MTADELTAWFTGQGHKPYRARQVLDAVWRGRQETVGEILTLPARIRDELEATFRFDTSIGRETRVTDGGLTEKSVHRLSDGLLIESVLMHYPARAGSRERHTLCISSQAGCAVGCPFCATGELGMERDLETAEIVDQVRHAARRLAADGRRLTNVVYMGMGEPLLNLDRVLESIEALNDPGRFGLGARHITVSTSGVVPGIRRLTALGPQFTLAISLHAARDALRDVLVPLNRRWPVGEVVEAAREHAAATGRRVTYEMTMIDGINDTRDRCRGPCRAPARRPRAREPHPDEPGRPHAVDRHTDPGRGAVRRDASRRGHPDHDPLQPGDGDRGRLRAARGRARGPAHAGRRPPAPRTPRRGERRGPAW